MKKIITLILCFIFVFAVLGCKDKTDNDTNENESSANQNSSERETDDDGIELADGTIIYFEGAISPDAKIEFKDENNNVLLTTESILKVSARYFPEGCYGIQLEFNENGIEKFKTLTEQNLGKPIHIFIDGQLISSPIVQDVIYDGIVNIINYSFEKEDIFELYDSLT
ncbi:MAG: hypothetical protein IJE02_05995 [Clostridia bacterium]|nr:hypothetical protein [Clostridia bacterium]